MEDFFFFNCDFNIKNAKTPSDFGSHFLDAPLHRDLFTKCSPPPRSYVFFFLSILLVGSLSRLFSEMLVAVFENTV